MKMFYQAMKRRISLDLLLVSLDIVSVMLAYLFCLLLRLDYLPDDWDDRYKWVSVFLSVYKQTIWLTVSGSIIAYALGHLYHRIWRFASVRELKACVLSVLAFAVAHGIIFRLFIYKMPISYFVLGPLFQLVLLMITRFGYRYFRSEVFRYMGKRDNQVNAMVIGGGKAAQMIIRDLNFSPESECHVFCAIDDDPVKQGCIIEGVPIVGGRDTIMSYVERYKIKRIFYAIPSSTPEDRREILNICKESGVQVMTLPGIYQLANKEVTVSNMREVAIADLLGRPPIKVNNEEILESLRGKTVLVTGGGGSIGSELCRQIAGHSPKHLVIFDVYENNAYDIEQELKRKYGSDLNLTVLIGSVRDTRRINQVFEQYKPEIVFHAAAHKHVPLMEESPCEAIKNNVLGTYKTACAAVANGTRRFVLISTDKAVNPTNIMGASKRLCEMVVQVMDRLGADGQLSKLPQIQAHHLQESEYRQESAVVSPLPAGVHTEFVAVRFGNVLGSNGSVIPLFKKQIAEGGPVTVTSPDIIRYFMTIPEAVSLVLQAETYAKGGEIFVFDMGEPMKIDTLARNLIQLSGHKPDVDIKIKYTGLRPGEKLYEERLMSEEGLRQTANKLISIANPTHIDVDIFLEKFLQIATAAYSNADEMKRLVSGVVETYKPEK